MAAFNEIKPGTLVSGNYEKIKKRKTQKHALQCSAATCGFAMFGSKLGYACGTHFGSDLRCACMQCIFRLAKCDRTLFAIRKELTCFWCKLLFCSSEMEDFSNFSEKNNNSWEINWKVLKFKTMFKS